MISTVTLAVLITLTYGGDLRVVEGLSDPACAEALCVARDGMTCAERKERDVAQAAAMKAQQELWEKAHPRAQLNCAGSVCYAPSATPYSMVTMSRNAGPGDIKTAVCTTPASKVPK